MSLTYMVVVVHATNYPTTDHILPRYICMMKCLSDLIDAAD